MKKYSAIIRFLCFMILLIASVPLSTYSNQTSAENPYDTDLSITHSDISFKTDFESNNVDAMVKSSLKNFSKNTVKTAEFWLCPGMNDPDLFADIKHIYFLDEGEKTELEYTVRNVQRNYKRVHIISFVRPVKPGEKLDLEFEYTITGKPDHSSAPIYKWKNGVKELFLRGDFYWCPSLFVESKKDVFLRLYRPDWTLRMEYPVGYVAVVDGLLVNQEEREGVIKEKWKSLMNCYAQVFISKYKVESWSGEGITLEVYAPDGESVKKASNKFNDYAKIFKLYVNLYGHPGSSIYRIIASPIVEGGAFGLVMGQVTDTDLLDETKYFAHEMAHTWWGSLVSSFGEGSKFLREAMAEFSSYYTMNILADENNSENWFLRAKRRRFCFHPGMAAVPKLHPLIQQEGHDAEKVTYENYRKGPLVLNHLRLTLGDDVFFQCLKNFLENNKGKSANIHDLIETIHSVSGRDMITDLQNLLWEPGYPSYRLVGFKSTKQESGFHTKVWIKNEGEYGLDCPLLLKSKEREQRRVFKVEGKDKKEFIFTTDEQVTDVVIDPDLTAFHYHAQQKARLWIPFTPQPRENWGWHGKAYAYYLIGEYEKAIDTITLYFSNYMEIKKLKNLEEAFSASINAPYLFMRGIYFLELDDRARAEKDIKLAFPRMLEMLPNMLDMSNKPNRTPFVYYMAGAIPEDDLDQYLALLSQIAGRDFSFESMLDVQAKKLKVKEWKDWWEKEGKHQKLDLTPLKERFEAQRKASLQ